MIQASKHTLCLESVERSLRSIKHPLGESLSIVIY